MRKFDKNSSYLVDLDAAFTESEKNNSVVKTIWVKSGDYMNIRMCFEDFKQEVDPKRLKENYFGTLWGADIRIDAKLNDGDIKIDCEYLGANI